MASSQQKAIQAEVVAIRGLLHQTAEAIVQIGLRLQMVRNLLGPHDFQDWLADEFEWSQPTASRYMRVAKLFADLGCIKQFQRSALYLLAQQQMSHSVREAAIARAHAGERITKSSVEQILGGGNHQAARDCGPYADIGRPLTEKLHGYLARITKNAADESIDEIADVLIRMGSELKQQKGLT